MDCPHPGPMRLKEGLVLVEHIEYLGRIADNGEFVPILASDRLQALRQLTDVNLDSLYMESKAHSGLVSKPNVFDAHVVKLKDGSFYLLEDLKDRSFHLDDVEKVYVGVDMT